MEKKMIADAVKKNSGKVKADMSNPDGRKKLESLVEHEGLKAHTKVVNDIADVQSTKKAKQMGSVPEKVMSKLSNVKAKLSNSKIVKCIAASKTLNKLAGKANKASSVLGKFFTAKAVINGIKQNDAFSLALVGGQLGFQIFTDAAVWAGAKFFKETSKIAKGAKILGAVAGPIGAALDIGFSLHSLGKSIDRLNNATNKFDRDEAIADIVSDSISIGVTVAVTSISIAVPPLAPIAAAVGFVIDIVKDIAVAMFKAWNEVRKIDEKLPLLDHEKAQVFQSRLFDWFGTRRDNYIDHLLKEKEANNIAVQNQIKFLEVNPSFRGVVFPSRSLHYDGGCKLTKTHCAWYLFTCLIKSKTRTIGEGCDHNKRCPYRACTDFDDNEGMTLPLVFSHDEYKCTCERDAKADFANFPRLNSEVDFRQEKIVWLERAVPDDVSGAEFKCKPGSLMDEGHRISQDGTTYDFYCKNAIAILRPEKNRYIEQAMIINLEDGEDVVYLNENENTPSIFLMGDKGNKQFYGGGGLNQFLFQGNCSLTGSISGGRALNDTISLDNSCATSYDISLKDNQITGGNLNINYKDIEIIEGRENAAEHVVLKSQDECRVKMVKLNGGTWNIPDKLDIPLSSCVWDLTVILSSNMEINSYAKQGKVSIYVGDSWQYNDISLEILPGGNHSAKDSHNILFHRTSSSQVTPYFTSSYTKGAAVTIESSEGDRLSLNLKVSSRYPHVSWQFPVLFAEEPDQVDRSVLTISNSTLLFYHRLPYFPATYRRYGSPATSNVFDVSGPNWVVKGGSESDRFILHMGGATLDGSDGYDILEFHEDFSSPSFNLRGTNIEQVDGIEGIPTRLWTDCDTKLVILQGGSSSNPDRIWATNSHCTERNLKIYGKGHTQVTIAGDAGTEMEDDLITMHISTDKNSTNFHLLLKSDAIPKLFVVIQMTQKVWKGLSLNDTTEILGQTGKIIRLPERISQATHFLMDPRVTVLMAKENEPTAQLIFDDANEAVRAQYILSEPPNSSAILTGILGIPNVFHIQSDNWNIAGVNEDDMFVLQSSSEDVEINGYTSSRLLVIVDKREENNSINQALQSYSVNLETGRVGFLSSRRKGRIEAIFNLVGRNLKPDIVHVNCDTKLVKGGGGFDYGAEDAIFVSGKNCKGGSSPQTTFATGPFTKLISAASFGHFIYEVDDILTSTFDIQPGSENFHDFRFRFHPWDVIEKVGLNEIEQKLLLQVINGTVREFKLHLEEGSDEYINPSFKFHIPGSSHTSDIKIFSDGFIKSTHVIQGSGLNSTDRVLGLPVHLNRFLINGTLSSGGIIRGNGSSSANQFWLFDIGYLDILDGGEGANVTNYFQLDNSFETGGNVTIDLHPELGSFVVNGYIAIGKLQNIHEFHGRVGQYDKVHVTCFTKVLSQAELIIVERKYGPEKGAFNLTINIEENTKVVFGEWDDWNEEDVLGSTFRYKFTAPRSFDIDGLDNGYTYATHQYLFSFTVDDLDTLEFDFENEILYYSINGLSYSHKTILEPAEGDPYYNQPEMVTKDGFEIRVGMEGSVYLVFGINRTQDLSFNDIMPAIEATVKRLSVSIIMQSETEIAYVGHGNREIAGARNVLQSLSNYTSYLGGGGAPDTIYDIVALDKDVHIYPGFTEEQLEEGVSEENKQSLDLTDVLVSLRKEAGVKFVPEVEKKDDKLIIKMTGYEDNYPGKVFIHGGANIRVANRFQILLHTSIMDLVPKKHENQPRRRRSINSEWEIIPRTIKIPEGYVFSVSVEDLEDNHKMEMANGTVITAGYKPVFQPAKDGNNLLLTDIITATENWNGDPFQKEITTIIIEDFYEPNQNKSEMPYKIANIRINFPGLNLLLDNETIYVVENADDMGNETLSEISVTPWIVLLHEAEEQILDWDDENILEPVFNQDEYDMPCPCSFIDFAGIFKDQCNCPIVQFMRQSETDF